MTTITAACVRASKHRLDGSLIYTMLLRYPRCIHAEFLTHRVFSKNSASSRAIPIRKLIKSVLEDPFVPVYWGANEKGMQAHSEVIGWRRFLARTLWLTAMYLIVGIVWCLHWLGLHKQIANRLLEPWAHITVVLTSTEWSNFLALRNHPAAEPHIQILARKIAEAQKFAYVEVLRPGEWHLPFITGVERGFDIEDQKVLSIARCASASYKTVDGFNMTLTKAREIIDKLRSSDVLHASPFEHQAQADDGTDLAWQDPVPCIKWNDTLGLHGNFREGWIQLRKTLPGECL